MDRFELDRKLTDIAFDYTNKIDECVHTLIKENSPATDQSKQGENK